MDPTMLIMLVAMIAVLFVTQTLSSRKRKKQETELRSSLTPGDVVTTIGGLYGKIVSVSDDSIVFETSEDRVRVEVAKWAVASKGKSTQETQK
ncbi:MAG: preprotein translocase subunit YajC [Oscillospiraceae bacterium]|jgi:preprotein translocase subunit YajC|nr:preprotein translocase subunit YajC [Oscillospiraceae bacterium]